MKLEEPKKIWNRDLKFDVKPLFANLTKAVINTIALSPKDAASNIVDAATNIGLESKPEEVAFSLIETSLLDALLSLTKESFSHLNPGDLRAKALEAEVARHLIGISVNINSCFFANPGGADFIGKIQGAYKLWLERIGATEKAAHAISQRLPAYFVHAISSEWRKNQKNYQALIELAESPFKGAEDIENGWALYFSFLERRINESIFDEPFSLSQIYVNLNAYYIKKNENAENLSPHMRTADERVCVDLATELTCWLKSGDKQDPLRVISGGPGSGKSSFTKIFCRDLAGSGTAKPIYIPLHLIDPTREISSEVERFIRDEGLLGFNPIASPRENDKLLLVFDGLDELASMGKVAAQVARDFVIAVERMLERRNLGPHPIFALISGREVIIQENETEFRKPKQLLTILPYWLSDDEKRAYKDPSNLLDLDLRNVWWEAYGKLTGLNYAGLPSELKTSEINEITSQPLLNYLVALSYKRGKLEFNKKLNLNSVYADLVAAVHERGYEKSRTYRPISHITHREFVRVLEEIGLAAWHGSDGRSTSVRDIMSHCQQSGLESLLKSFTEGAEAGITKLLAAFFFRRNGETVGEDAAFVFTHKSFGEYLTATRLVRGLERVVNERKRRLKDPDDGMDVPEALTFWLKLAGPAPLTEYLQKFLSREISQYSKEELEEWQGILCELSNHAIDRMMPVEKVGNLNFSKSVAYDNNASTALIVSLNACATTLKRVSVLSLSSNVSFGGFLRRTCPQRNGPKSPLLYSALSYLDITGQCLDMADLYGANLSNSVLKNSAAHFATFAYSNLSNADLTNCQLGWSRFETRSMKGANFSGSKLIDCIIEGTVDSVIFDDTVLQGSDVEKAAFTGCSFKNANIHNVKFNKSNLVEGCDFEGAYTGKSQYGLKKWFEKALSQGKVTGQIKAIENEDLDL